MSWDPVTDPDGDPITYSFLVKVDNVLVNRFPGLEDPITTSSVFVVLEPGVDYEIVVIVNDGTFRRFASPFFYYIL